MAGENHSQAGIIHSDLDLGAECVVTIYATDIGRYLFVLTASSTALTVQSLSLAISVRPCPSVTFCSSVRLCFHPSFSLRSCRSSSVISFDFWGGKFCRKFSGNFAGFSQTRKRKAQKYQGTLGGAEMTIILSDNNSWILPAPWSNPLEGGGGVIVQNYCHCISWEKSDDNKNVIFQNAAFPVL